MPSWPRPVDVYFDYGAAQNAITSVNTMKFALAWGWGSESTAARTALNDWRGQAARNFSSTHGNHHNTVVGLGEQLQSLQDELEDAVEAAGMEQWRRVRLQDEWDRQLAAERAAAAAAQAAAQAAAAQAAADAAAETGDTEPDLWGPQ